ncbi:hypothetical protein Peur_042643 [Populus x canadensis]
MECFLGFFYPRSQRMRHANHSICIQLLEFFLGLERRFALNIPLLVPYKRRLGSEG